MTAIPLVAWWRHSRAVVEVPRRHRIGWCDVTGDPHGHLEIISPHVRLDRRQIETALTADLTDLHHYPSPPRIAPAHTVTDQLGAAARLRVAGHRIVDRDLLSTYGLHVVGGVIATLLGQGVEATIVADRSLSDPVREATLHAAEQAIEDFRTATPDELYEAGWDRTGEHGWQLILRQR